MPDFASHPDVLILGGTGEARALAAALHDAGVPVISSLAGRVRDPALPVGAVRIGGFGGPDGLADYLCAQPIGAVVDATHPFAATISAHAARACSEAGVPVLRLARPGWADHPLAGTWHWVDGYRAAGEAAAGARVLLTTGRTTLDEVTTMDAPFVLVRLVEPAPLPAGWIPVISRGPYTVAGEVALMREHRIEVLVTKDSGGTMTEPKLIAAHQLSVRVVVVRRPAAEPGVPAVGTVDAAAGWVLSRAGASGS